MSGIVYACIAPHPPVLVHEVGRGRELETKRTIAALDTVAQELAAHRPDTVVLFSPHGPVTAGSIGILTAPAVRGDLARWGAADVRFEYENDLDLVALVREEARRAGVPLTAIERWDDGLNPGLDWGCTVPLYYLQSGVAGARLVPLTPSTLSPQGHYAFGEALGRALRRLDRRVAIVCSADLSHCLLPGAPSPYDPAGRRFDNAFQEVITHWDVDWVLNTTSDFRYHAAEDAIPQTAMLMGALSAYRVRPRVLSYEGPFGVGYMVAAIDVIDTASDEGDAAAEPAISHTEAPVPSHPLVQLAKQTVERYVRAESLPQPHSIAKELGPTADFERPAAVFVSIKKWGDLRGCIGTIEPTQENLGMEIVRNAVAACSQDPRFSPVGEEELAHLTYSVDVLTPPQPVTGPHQLDPKRYGVIVRSGLRRGLLLPDLEGVDSVEEQVRIAREKAGILPDEPVDLYRFEVERYT